MNARRTLAHIAFALLLLVSQQLGIVHALSHLPDNTGSSQSQKKQLPAEFQCDQCLAFAALGSGLTNSASAFPSSLVPPESSGETPLAVAPSTVILPFHSRAPPALI